MDEATGVLFPVGQSIGGFTSKEFWYHPSNTALSQRNVGVIGDLGTGKTQSCGCRISFLVAVIIASLSIWELSFVTDVICHVA